MNLKKWCKENKKILIINFVVIVIVILVFVFVKLMNPKSCNINTVEETIHMNKEVNKINYFIENSLNYLREINKNLKDNDNSESLQENLFPLKKKSIDEINNNWLILDTSFNNINPNSQNDFNSIFENIHNFEEKIKNLKPDQNVNDDKNNILENILTNSKIIEQEFRKMSSSKNDNINNSDSNANQNQNEKEIMQKIKDIKESEKNFDDNESVKNFWIYNNLSKIINDSQYENIKKFSINFKPQNVKTKKIIEMKKIISDLEKELNKQCPNLTSTDSNEKIITLDSLENINKQKESFYSIISTNCENIKNSIKQLNEKIENLNKKTNYLKKTTNLKTNVIKCIELLSIFKENKNYDSNYFKNNKEFREIFYFFKDLEDIQLKKIFDEYLKVCENIKNIV